VSGFRTRLQSTDFVLDKVLIHEDERIRLDRLHTPPQARDDTSNFKFSGVPPAPFLIFRIPYSNFRIPDTLCHVARIKLQFHLRLNWPPS
jgi:hypothetical protein